MARQRLQDEIKKREPFQSPQHEALLNILRTADRLQIHFSRLFRQYALTNSQYNILRILRGEGKPLPILEIAERTLTVVPGITGLIDRLEKAELVARQRCEEDRRVVYVEITPAGLRVLKKIDAPHEALHQQLLGHMSDRQLEQLSQLLVSARKVEP